MAQSNSRWRTLLALTPLVLGAIAASVVGLLIVRRFAAVEVLRQTNDVVGNYLQTVGSVYAVLLAFVVFVVWTQFNEARAQLESEANEVVDLFRIAKGFPDSMRVPLQDRLRRYAEAVLGGEWAAMARCVPHGTDEAGQMLDEAWDVLRAFETGNDCHVTLYGEALSRFNDLSDLRTARLTAARTRIPFALRLLLYFGAVILVGSMWLFAVDSLLVHALITSAMAGAISHVLYLVEDLDAAFSGNFQILREPFEHALAYASRTT